MENEVLVYDADENVPALADDSLLRVAEMAERRIDAVIKIKQMALKVTNASDWTDQNGKPYLQASGSEKVANLFNVSWRLDEPVCETEPDGHFTYTMRGIFSIPGRSISAEGSRSSKDPFFKKYDWTTGQKVEKPITAIDRRDVRMAALTNLLGNGITRLLGIRNLSYGDLESFAGITKDMLAKVDYTGKGKGNGNGKTGPGYKEPQKKDNGNAEAAVVKVSDVLERAGEKNGREYVIYTVIDSTGEKYTTFSKSIADVARSAIPTEGEVNISYTVNKFGNTIEELTLTEAREPGQEG